MKVRLAGGFLAPSGRKAGDKIARFERGRVCEVMDCDTVLSTYNPARLCSLHAATTPHTRP